VCALILCCCHCSAPRCHVCSVELLTSAIMRCSTPPRSRRVCFKVSVLSGQLLSLLALSLGLAGCASPKQPINDQPAAVQPQIFTFFYSGWGAERRTYMADGEQVSREIDMPDPSQGGKPTLAEQAETYPSPEQWRAFNREIDRLDVLYWKRKYDPMDVGSLVSDGTIWALSLTMGKVSVKSRGDNAYPTIGHPERTTLEMDAFEHLVQAFETLMRTPSLRPRPAFDPSLGETYQSS